MRVLQAHKIKIDKTGSAVREMAQFINELAHENEEKSMWIGSMLKEARAQAGVLREHQARQQVLAEAMKRMMVWLHHGQPPQQQGVTESMLWRLTLTKTMEPTWIFWVARTPTGDHQISGRYRC